MPQVADVSTNPSCNGCENCGTCESCLFNALPGIISGGAQAVATITNANNSTKLAQLNANTQLAAAQLNAASTQKIVMEVMLMVGIIAAVYLVANASSK